MAAEKNYLQRSIRRLNTCLQHRYGILPVSQSIPQLEQWLDSPLGCALLEQEQVSLDKSLGCLFGYHLMQMSISRKLSLVQASKINHRFVLSPCQKTLGSHINGQTEFDCLPLPEESIDVAVLHHVLEFSQSPHQLLREVSRVIIPRGHIVIVGFNPWSLLGACKPFAQLCSSQAQWRYHGLRLGRLLDWLRLLDFEPVSIDRGFFCPPISRRAVLKRMGWMDRAARCLHLPNGGYYCIVARKEIHAMTPIRPAWKRLNPIMGLAVSKPSTRIPDPVPVPKTRSCSNY